MITSPEKEKSSVTYYFHHECSKHTQCNTPVENNQWKVFVKPEIGHCGVSGVDSDVSHGAWSRSRLVEVREREKKRERMRIYYN